MSWSIAGSFSPREKVSKANEHLGWLKQHSYLLDGSEIIRIEAIVQAKSWKVAAFDYLEGKRQKYDADYKEIKSLENRMSQTAKALRDFEAHKAQRELKAHEDLLEANRRLEEENYWLKTELSGMKQTAAIIQKANRR